MMKRVLVLFAHPNPSQSRINVKMAKAASKIDGVTVCDLYADYPRFKINVEREQQLLVSHDVVVMQFPFYWYSTPALLKEWQDLVLEFGFAYGTDGDKLAGKSLLVATTAGGGADAYKADGCNHFPIRQLLTPIEQTANLCQMPYLPPFVLYSALAAANSERAAWHIKRYETLLSVLRDDSLDVNAVSGLAVLPDVLPLRVEDRR